MSVPVPTRNLCSERLYLSKGSDGGIYVNNSSVLRKNQINGLRGLYRIYKKKNPGVILNDAPGSGKTVLVTLFIQSLQSILDNPVLILCHENNEIEYWKEIILKWTGYSEDNIAINSTNPYLKKNIFIQSMNLGNSFYRRCWSVLILKNDEITKEISKMVFDAEFKIWLTSVDVFKDLNMLSSVGKYINPSVNINTAEFERETKKLSEKIEMVALLEASTKDFVVRMDHLKSILQKTNNTNNPVSNIASKKNKNSSGTKIKKSKRKINDKELNDISKKAAAKVIKTNDEQNATEQDSPSIISFELNQNYSKTHEVNIEHNHQSVENVTSIIENNILERNAQIPIDEDSTQSLLSENSTKGIETMSQIKTDNIVDVEMPPKLNIEDNVTDNLDSVVTNEDNQIKSDDMYDNETVDLNVDTSQIVLNYTEDVDIDDKINTQLNTEKENENNIVKSEGENATVPNKIQMANIVSPSTIPNTQATENDGNTIDKKLNDLEMKTLMKFKGSFLDSIF